MVNLAQVIKGLRASRSRAQKQIRRLGNAIAALGKLDGNAGRRASRNVTGETEAFCRCAEEDIASPESTLG